MDDTQLMQILHSTDQLSKIFTCFLFFEAFLFDNEFKELSLGYVLHDQKKLFGCFYDLIELYEVGMANLLENVYLSGDSFNISHVAYLTFLEDLDCNLFAC
jgi:hypothetical protein